MHLIEMNLQIGEMKVVPEYNITLLFTFLFYMF